LNGPNKTEQKPEKTISLAETVGILWQKKIPISLVVGTVTLCAVIYSLLLAPTYRSTAVILPEADRSKLGGLSSMADLASLAGINIGGDGSLVRLYQTIITSEAVLKNVLQAKYQTALYKDSVDLIQYWKITASTPELGYEIALNSLRAQLGVTVERQTSVVSVSMETPEPQLSADIVNTATRELDKYIRTRRTTTAGGQREFIEGRLRQIKEDLEHSEDSLKDFRERNRSVIGSPPLLLQQERLLRDVQINSTLFIEMKKQYEIAKIEEVRNIPVVSVMDPGRPSAIQAGPQKRKIVLIAFFASFLLIAGYVLVVNLFPDQIRSIADSLGIQRTRKKRLLDEGHLRGS
jgi:uncharacterized protein involved in exopolysaccharide biosynthesis